MQPPGRSSPARSPLRAPSVNKQQGQLLRRARQVLVPAVVLLVVVVINLRRPPLSNQGAQGRAQSLRHGRAAEPVVTSATSGQAEFSGTGVRLANVELDEGEYADGIGSPQQRYGATAAPTGSAAAAGTFGGIPISSSYALEAEGGQHAPRYSTHTCINQKFYDNWHAATCKFDNICLNISSLQFEYYQDPQLPDIPIFYNQEGVAMAEFSPHMVNTGHAHLNMSEEMGWRPVVVRRTFPSPTEGPHIRWAPVPQALLHSIAVDLTVNFGHVMYDVLVPLFNMQHVFGVYTPEAQALILGAINGPEEELRATLPRLIRTPDPAMSLHRLTWNHDMEWVGEYARRMLPRHVDGLVCFKTVLAGTGYLNRQMSPTDALPYRQAAVQNIGLQEPPHARPVITILNKQGRRMIENSLVVRDYLQARHPHALVNMFDFGEHPGMTMPEQVKLMSETTILVTPCGGLATVLTFMRPGATAIAMNYWHTGFNRSMQLEDNYYRHIEYLDIQYFPVTPEDYQNTTDRPDCENKQNGTRAQDQHYGLIGALVHCNLRLERSGLVRLGYYVEQAMRRWAARTGRYEVLAPAGTAHSQHAQQKTQHVQQQQQKAQAQQQQQQQKAQAQQGNAQQQQQPQQQHGGAPAGQVGAQQATGTAAVAEAR